MYLYIYILFGPLGQSPSCRISPSTQVDLIELLDLGLGDQHVIDIKLVGFMLDTSMRIDSSHLVGLGELDRILSHDSRSFSWW